MAEGFNGFAKQVESLAWEWKELNAELERSNGKIDVTEAKVQKLRQQRDEIRADLIEVEKRQGVSSTIL